MIEYIFCAFVIFFFKFITLLECKLKNISVFSIVFAFFILAAFRGDVGSDTYSYAEIYSVFLEYDYSIFSFRFEPVFIFIMKICSIFTTDKQSLLIMYAFLQCVFLYLIVKKVKQPFLFLTLYFFAFYFQFHLNTIRVGLAVLIFIYSLQIKRPANSFLILTLAILSHFSILLLIPFWVVYKKLMNWKVVTVFSIFTVLFLFFISDYIFIKVALYFQGEQKKIAISPIAMILFTSPFFSYCLLSLLRMRLSLKVLFYYLTLVSSVVGIVYVDIFYRLYILIILFMLFIICNDEVFFNKYLNRLFLKSIFVISIIVPSVYAIATERKNVERINGVNSLEYKYTFIPYSSFFTK